VGTGIHGYGYYDTRTRPVNIRVYKPVPVTREYPFTIYISYPCGFYPQIPVGTNFFDIPTWGIRPPKINGGCHHFNQGSR